MANDDEDGAADVVTDEETSPLAGLDAAADASVDVVEDLDDLFDASGDDVADVIVDGAEAVADSASEADAPLTSRGGG
jgi:hypothetical protein